MTYGARSSARLKESARGEDFVCAEVDEGFIYMNRGVWDEKKNEVVGGVMGLVSVLSMFDGRKLKVDYIGAVKCELIIHWLDNEERGFKKNVKCFSR